MALKTGDAYRRSLAALRPNIHKWGRLVEDVTTHPATRLHVDAIAASYDAAFDPERAPVFTARSHLTGERAHRWNTLMRDADGVLGNARLKRAQFRNTGTCHGATCVGWTAVNALWAATHEADAKLGTDYTPASAPISPTSRTRRARWRARSPTPRGTARSGRHSSRSRTRTCT